MRGEGRGLLVSKGNVDGVRAGERNKGLSQQSWLWTPHGQRGAGVGERGPDSAPVRSRPGEGSPEKGPKGQRTGRPEEVGLLWWELRLGVLGSRLSHR